MTGLRPGAPALKYRAMLIFTDTGPRSVDDRDVLFVYRGGGDGRYTHCTLVLHHGTEVSGAVLTEALDALEGRGVLPAALCERGRCSPEFHALQKIVEG